MRVSVLFVLTVAILAGLGVAVFIRQSGLLNPPAPIRAEPLPAPTVLVAARVFFEGDVFYPTDVVVRPLRPNELKEYEANKDQYLQPSQLATLLRYAARDLPADLPLKQSDLQAMKKPNPLAERLPLGAKAINIGLQVEHAEGGQIAVGDWVDVYVTSQIGRSDQPNQTDTRTTLVARAALVVAKRNSLWPVYAPLPPNELVYHTLAVNPYRAALIEHARTNGTLTLVTTNKDQQSALNERKASLREPVDIVSLSIQDPESEAYKQELTQIARYSQGNLSLGPRDLAELFGLEPLRAPIPPPSAQQVELFRGTQRAGEFMYTPAGKSTPPEAPRYSFAPLPVPDAKEDGKDKKEPPRTPRVVPISPPPKGKS